MKKLKEVGLNLKWEKELNQIKVYAPKEESEFWKWVVTSYNFSAFNNSVALCEFLIDFYKKINIEHYSYTLVHNLYGHCLATHKFDNNEDLFFYFAARIKVGYAFFEVLMAKYKFLFSNPISLNKEEFSIFDKFWKAFFKSAQDNIPVSFMNKHLYFFFQNKDYFYDKICVNKVFFKLDQKIINKFKSAKRSKNGN